MFKIELNGLSYISDFIQWQMRGPLSLGPELSMVNLSWNSSGQHQDLVFSLYLTLQIEYIFGTSEPVTSTPFTELSSMIRSTRLHSARNYRVQRRASCLPSVWSEARLRFTPLNQSTSLRDPKNAEMSWKSSYIMFQLFKNVTFLLNQQYRLYESRLRGHTKWYFTPIIKNAFINK